MEEHNYGNSFLAGMPEIGNCLVCHDPVCTKACPQGTDVGGVLRSLYFGNNLGAVGKLNCDCTGCEAPCEKACVIGFDRRPVAIRSAMLHLKQGASMLPRHRREQVDLSADICGVRLENPFLLASSVVSSSYEMCNRAFNAGWAGAAFKTICSFPQHETSPRFSAVRYHTKAFFGFKNIEQLSDHSVAENIQVHRQL